jgi:hypothetical protein
MELDEMKIAWIALDERLKKNEELNEKVIKEMLMQKSTKSLKKLANYEIFGMILTLLIMPFIIYMLSLAKTITLKTIFYSALGMLVLATISQLYKIVLISKINIQKEIKENIKFVQRYNIYIKRETFVSVIVASLFLIACIVALLLLGYKEPWRWTAVIISIFGIWPLGMYWQYKVYKANIQSVLESLDELKELEQ